MQLDKNQKEFSLEVEKKSGAGEYIFYKYEIIKTNVCWNAYLGVIVYWLHVSNPTEWYMDY